MGAPVVRSHIVINRRHGIVAAAAPGMAGEEPPRRKPTAARRAMLAHRLGGIVRAGRQIAASGADERRHEKLIEADRAAQEEAHSAPSPRQAPSRFNAISRSATSAAKSRAAVEP